MRNEYVNLVEHLSFERILKESGETTYQYTQRLDSNKGLIFTFDTKVNNFVVGLGADNKFEVNDGKLETLKFASEDEANIHSPNVIVSIDFARYDSDELSFDYIEDFGDYEQFLSDFGHGEDLDDIDDEPKEKENFISVVSTVFKIVLEHIHKPRKEQYPDLPIVYYFKGISRENESSDGANSRERIYLKLMDRNLNKLGNAETTKMKKGFLVKIT
jgi:hypothetical protein